MVDDESAEDKAEEASLGAEEGDRCHGEEGGRRYEGRTGRPADDRRVGREAAAQHGEVGPCARVRAQRTRVVAAAGQPG